MSAICQDTDGIDKKVDDLRAEINRDIGGEPVLSYQRSQRMFDVTIDRYPDPATGATIAMRIKGKLRGIESQGGGDAKLKTLLRFLDKHMKKGCVQKVIFLPAGSTGTSTSSDQGFEWGACDDPYIMCSNGVCMTSCGPGGVANTIAGPGNSNSANSNRANMNTSNANVNTANRGSNQNQ